MHKKWVLAALSILACSLCAQSKQNLDQQDLLAAFEQYNPSVLARAAENDEYGKILHQLTVEFSMPDTIENKTEMIALVKNFDNSLRLYMLRQAYLEGRTLQLVSGTQLIALENSMMDQLTAVLQDVYKNTLEAKDIQIKQYKQQIKTVQKTDTLSKEQRKAEIAQLNQKIKDVKREVRSLKNYSQRPIII